MKPVNRGIAAPGELLGDGGGLPAVPGDAALPEAARRPLRELMDDALLDALLERSRDQAGAGTYAAAEELATSRCNLVPRQPRRSLHTAD